MLANYHEGKEVINEKEGKLMSAKEKDAGIIFSLADLFKDLLMLKIFMVARKL